MKILFLSAANSSHTVKWVNTLAQHGHKVLLASQVDHRAEEGVLLPLVQVEYLVHGGPLGYYRNAPQLKELAAVYQPEVVNVHYATGYGTLGRRACLHPVLLSVWGSDVYDFPQKGYFQRRMLEKNLASAAAVASTSHIMAECTKQYIHDDTPVFITPFGVDTERFKPLPNTASGEFVIGTVKRLEPECGIDILLKAFKIFRTMVRIHEPQKKLRLKIYGQGSEYTPLLGLAREILISDETDFMGQVPNTEVPLALAQMDIVCLPSRRESFGVAALEAMACERAVVASDADGFLETIKDGQTGIIVHELDENTLADALFKLYQNDLLRRALGYAGRQHVQQQYGTEQCLIQMEEALFYAAHAR